MIKKVSIFSGINQTFYNKILRQPCSICIT